MQPEDYEERAPTKVEALLARMEQAREQGRGARLSNDDLHLLSVSIFGEAMAQAREMVAASGEA